MTTKLVSANLGLILEIERDGKVEKVQLSTVCPSESSLNLETAIQHLLAFLDKNTGTEFYIGWTHNPIKIAKPKWIKASKKISQAEFNRKIKELVP